MRHDLVFPARNYLAQEELLDVRRRLEETFNVEAGLA